MDHYQCERGETRDIFSWKAQWDFLFTVVTLNETARTSRAFLISRDAIPHEWWTAEYEEQKWLEWPRERALELARYNINIWRPRQLVSKAESILLDQKKISLKASVRIPMKRWAPVAALHDEPWQHNPHINPPGPEYTWSSEGYLRGFGSCKHKELRGDTSQSWSAEVLMELSQAE